MRRAQGTDFSSVPRANIPRSTIMRNHGHKTTFNSGLLIPIFVDEALPGDTLSLSMTAFGRLATPLHPYMDNLYVETFFFAVPNRLLWSNWEKFNGEQDNPGDSVDFLVPQMTSPASTGYDEQSMSDYFGIPTKVPGLKHNAWWHRAYNLVYNDWFRDENLQDSVKENKGDGPDDPADYVLLRRGKRHDYFTSCLPWPQKGPPVPLPLTGDAPVKGFGVDTTVPSGAIAPETIDSTGTKYPAGSLTGTNSNQGTYITRVGTATDSAPAIFADLSEVTAATINDLRLAFQVQKLYERDARGGTRYVEIIKSHFGVTSPDYRLQRPEYLGGGSSPINVNPIAQTSSTDATSPQGNLAAMGTFNANRHGFTKSFTEHSILIGLACVRADLNYQQGLNRMFSRQTRFDYYWPALAMIGEQPVLSKEIFADGTADDDLAFGYQPKDQDYRYKPSQITGRFRSNAAQSLETWHLAQKFENRPTLSATFIEENPPVDRIIAVTTEPEILFDSWFRYRCVRPMPVESVPGLIDHF